MKWITVLCCGFLSISLNKVDVQLSGVIMTSGCAVDGSLINQQKCSLAFLVTNETFGIVSNRVV